MQERLEDVVSLVDVRLGLLDHTAQGLENQPLRVDVGGDLRVVGQAGEPRGPGDPDSAPIPA